MREIQWQLNEREKELDGLYALAELFTRAGIGSSELISGTVQILRASMQEPEITCIAVTAPACSSISPEGMRSEQPVYTVRRTFSLEKELTIDVSRLDTEPILERERSLIASAADLLANSLERRELEQAMRETAGVLQEQAEQLEHKNIALREILSQIQKERDEQLNRVSARVETDILPFIGRLLHSGRLTEDERTLITHLQRSLKDLALPAHALPELAGLTPREAEIAMLVRSGAANKEISRLLNISVQTVERHRTTIRRKLNIGGTGVNLTTFLRSGKAPVDPVENR